jgi:hypothetical protein
MGIMFGMLKNRLYLIDKWISKGSGELLVLLLVVLSVFFLNNESTLFYGIGLIGIVCVWVVFVKSKIMCGKLKFDKSYYTLPIIGEKIVVQRDFKYDLNKVENSRNYINSESLISIYKGLEFYVKDIEELDDNWVVSLRVNENGGVIDVFYLDVKDYFMTLSDIREEKLKRILK